MQTVFITGGSGFIGRNLIRGLLEAGYPVRALARSDASAQVVQRLGAQAVRGDVLDRAALTLGMQGCDGLIHAAADTNHGVGDPAQERVNVEGTRTVFQAARAAGVQRAVQISTEAVLADGQPIVLADESRPLPARHAGGYSRTKALAEQTALAQAGAGFVVCAIRPRFVWGRDDTSALPQLMAAASDGRLKWIDGGSYLTSTAHVANVAVGAIAALVHGRSGQAYFITDGAPLAFRQFISALLATRGIEVKAGSVPRWLVKPLVSAGSWLQSVSGGLIKPPMSAQEYASMAHEVTLSDARARTELGYAPVLTVEQGLAEMRPGGAWATQPAG